MNNKNPRFPAPKRKAKHGQTTAIWGAPLQRDSAWSQFSREHLIKLICKERKELERSECRTKELESEKALFLLKEKKVLPISNPNKMKILRELNTKLISELDRLKRDTEEKDMQSEEVADSLRELVKGCIDDQDKRMKGAVMMIKRLRKAVDHERYERVKTESAMKKQEEQHCKEKERVYANMQILDERMKKERESHNETKKEMERQTKESVSAWNQRLSQKSKETKLNVIIAFVAGIIAIFVRIKW